MHDPGERNLFTRSIQCADFETDAFTAYLISECVKAIVVRACLIDQRPSPAEAVAIQAQRELAGGQTVLHHNATFDHVQGRSFDGEGHGDVDDLQRSRIWTEV